MTVDVEPLVPATRTRSIELPAISRTTVLEGGVVTVAVAVFAWYVMPGMGGRDTAKLTAALLVASVCFVATAAWRRLRPAVLGLAAAVGLAALLVCLVSPTAGAGLRTGAIYVLGALTYASVAAFCRTPARRTAAAVTAALLGLLQLAQALTAWLPGMDPSRLMIGTFFWHNQFGAYMLGTGLTAGVIALMGDRAWRCIATAVTPLCISGVLLSGSRGSILVLAVGWAAVGGLAGAQRAGALRGLGRWLLVTALAAVAVTALTSGLFFARSAAPTAAVESRGEGSTESSLRYRITTDRAALAVIRAHPWTGAGFDSFLAAGSPHMPAGFTRSPYVHNGYLQAAEEGGLLLALPVLSSLAAAGWAAVRRRGHSWRRVGGDWPRVACAAGAAGLLTHAAIDMDWSFPGLVVLTMLLLGVAGGESARRAGVPVRFGRCFPSVLAVVILGIGVGSAAGVTQWQKVHTRDRADTTSSAARAASRFGVFRDPRVDARVLAAAVPLEFAGTVTEPHAVVAESLIRTARLAVVDAALQMQRAQAYVALGRPEEGVRLAAELVAEQATNRPFLVSEYAEILAAVGRHRDAVDRLADALEGTAHGPAIFGWHLVATLQRIDPAGSARRAWCAAATIVASGDRPAGLAALILPAMPTSCPSVVP